MKLLSLLKAALSQDMNMFRFKAGKNSSKIKKVLFPVTMFLIVCFAFGVYAYLIADVLAPFNLTYVMLSMFMLLVTILAFWSGIYKSQGILFDAKDNDLLFSLPIKKSQILFVRIIKLLVFQYIYNLMYLLPAFVVYIYYEKTGITFYFVSILMSILIVIIPTVLSSVLGYIVKLVSSKFKSKKIMQTLLTFAVFLGVFFLSYNVEEFILNLAQNATSINDMITKIYYPIGLYINLITKFNILDLIKLLVVNIVPLILFILIGAKYYFKIVSKSKENSVKRKINNKKDIEKQNKPVNALVKKEIKRFFSSMIYMFNTSFGLLLGVIAPIFLPTDIDIINSVLQEEGLNFNLPISVLFYFLLLFIGAMTTISASSISLEGKTINITKSLPISEKLILKSKILTCYIIELPFFIISNLIFFIRFKPSLIYVILLAICSLVIIFLISCIGLIANLKYPRMDANSDTEVVKQSMSAMIATFAGIGLCVGSMALIIYLSQYITPELAIVIHLSILIILSVALYIYLMKKGSKMYRNINV